MPTVARVISREEVEDALKYYYSIQDLKRALRVSTRRLNALLQSYGLKRNPSLSSHVRFVPTKDALEMAIQATNNGSAYEIAKLLKCHHETVNKYIEIYGLNGGVHRLISRPHTMIQKLINRAIDICGSHNIEDIAYEIEQLNYSAGEIIKISDIKNTIEKRKAI